MLKRCQSSMHRPPLKWLLLFLSTILIFASCSKPPTPVTGHSTALNPNLPVYDPFTSAYPTAMPPGPVHQPATQADDFFSGDITQLHIKITAAEWENLIRDFTASENRSGIKRHAHLAVGETIIQDVGLSVMGRGSLVAPEQDGIIQRSNFFIDFGATFADDATVFGSDPIQALPENTGRHFNDLPALILKANDRDRTYLRPHLVSEMMLEFGVPTPRIGFAALHLEIGEGESVYLGVYALHEVIDGQWFEKTLGKVSCIFDVGKGDLGYGYLDQVEKDEGRDRNKWCDRGLIGESIINNENPRWRGKPFKPTYAYKGGSDDCPQCQEHLNALITALVGEELSFAELDNLVDAETMLRSLTISAFSANVDDFWIFGNNGFLCRVWQDGRWRWTMVPIDYDLTFNQEFETLRNPTGSILRYGIGSTLGGQMLAHEQYRSRYRDLVLGWYMELKQNSVATRIEDALVPIRQYLRGYDAKDPNSFSRAAVLDLIRFCDGKMKMIEKELGLQ